MFDPRKENEPNCDVLIASTKMIADKASVTNGTAGGNNWRASLRNCVTDLLAHIFAIWTLKNTAHLSNAEAASADSLSSSGEKTTATPASRTSTSSLPTSERDYYMMMPHAAQVVACLRLLGIGYTSNELVNNLAEIGTGEGKSIIIAVTACLFALIGMDVNCSCYSDYLSVRDKTQFAELFRTLGVDKHIEYGTFNRLCEDVLNSRCNLRERVHELIASNADSLAVPATPAAEELSGGDVLFEDAGNGVTSFENSSKVREEINRK